MRNHEDKKSDGARFENLAGHSITLRRLIQLSGNERFYGHPVEIFLEIINYFNYYIDNTAFLALLLVLSFGVTTQEINQDWEWLLHNVQRRLQFLENQEDITDFVLNKIKSELVGDHDIGNYKNYLMFYFPQFLV